MFTPSNDTPPSPPELVSVPAIATPLTAWLMPPGVVMSIVPAAPTLMVLARVNAMLSTSVNPLAEKFVSAPIRLVGDVSDTGPAMPPLLVSEAAIKLLPGASVRPPDEMVKSAPPAPATTGPASVSAALSTTAKAPPVVTAASVPILLPVPPNTKAPAIPPLLVTEPAISVAPVPCVTSPAVVVRSTVPPAPTLTIPAKASA